MPTQNLLSSKILYLSILLALLSMLIFQNCSKNDNPVTPPDDSGTVSKLDTIINVDVTDAYIPYQNSIKLHIPQGAVSGDTKLIIKQLSESSVPSDSEMDFPNTYEITLGSQHIFQKPLDITLNYDPAKLIPGIFKYKIGAAYYNDTTSTWSLFQDVKIDSVNNTIKFSTTHLTKLSWWHFKSIIGYTDYLTSPHFIAYWIDGKVTSNADLKSTLTNHKGSAPYYIQDMLYFLEEAWSAYKKANLQVPTDTTNKVEVRVQDIPGGVDGETKYLGYININQKIQSNKYFSSPDDLLKVICAHEFLHYVQDYYFLQTFAGKYTQWWWEATAVNADRIVWPNKSIFEAINYANGHLEDQLDRPWDDCNVDPDYYIAGGFLTYLTTYKDGAKLSIPEIIKETGKATNVSYIRTIIDKYLKNNLSSKGIYIEYAKYIKWAYEHKGPIYIDYTRPSPTSPYKYIVPVLLSKSLSTWNGNVAVSDLAIKMVKIKPTDFPFPTTIKIVLNKQDTQIEQYVYVSDNNKTVYKKYLVTNDTLKITLDSKDQWIDILSTNTGDKGSFDLSVAVAESPTITSITPNSAAVGETVKIIGNSFGTAGEVWFGTVKALASDIVSWIDTQIDVKVPVGATSCNVHIVVNGSKSNDVGFTVIGTPTITNITPNSAAVGATVKIIGNSLGTTGEVWFGAVKALASDIVSWIDSQIEVKVPVGAQTGSVHIEVNGLKSNYVSFTVGGPVITNITPNSGAVGEKVTISGNSFGTTGEVWFGTVKALASDIVSWIDTLIEVKVPAGAQSGDVYIVSNGVKSNGYSFTVGSPVINNIFPQSEAVGHKVIIIGSNFGTTGGEVWFGAVKSLPVNILSWSDTEIEVLVPVGAQTGNVNVVVGGSESNDFNFTVLHQLEIISPYFETFFNCVLHRTFSNSPADDYNTSFSPHFNFIDSLWTINNNTLSIKITYANSSTINSKSLTITVDNILNPILVTHFEYSETVNLPEDQYGNSLNRETIITGGNIPVSQDSGPTIIKFNLTGDVSTNILSIKYTFDDNNSISGYSRHDELTSYSVTNSKIKIGYTIK